jgi:uncharacterized membrane protein
MNRLLLASTLLLLIQCAPGAYAQSIRQFDVTIKFDKSMKVKVVEDITVDLGTEGKSGFIRSVPEAHFKGERFAKEVVGGVENDTPNQYENDENGNVSLIIRAPGVVARGIHTYRIGYESDSAMTIDGDKAKFTWDASGTQVKIPIDKMKVLISLPSEVGAGESVETTATKAGDAKGVKIEKSAGFIKYTTDFIYPGQSLIINATFPSEIFQPKTALDKSQTFFDTTTGRVILIIAALMFLALVFSAVLAKRDHMR